MPGLSWEITRANAVHLVGFDLDGNEIDVETDEYEGRIFQHEMDHLDGVLLIERLDDDQRKEAKKILRAATTRVSAATTPTGSTRCSATRCASPSSARPRRAVPSLRGAGRRRTRRRPGRHPPRPAPRPGRRAVAESRSRRPRWTRPARRAIDSSDLDDSTSNAASSSPTGD